MIVGLRVGHRLHWPEGDCAVPASPEIPLSAVDERAAVRDAREGVGAAEPVPEVGVI